MRRAANILGNIGVVIGFGFVLYLIGFGFGALYGAGRLCYYQFVEPAPKCFQGMSQGVPIPSNDCRTML